MKGQELLEMAESYLGSVIFPTEYKEAEQYAQRKLDRIISREGDGNGERRKPYYIAQLIAETVRSNRFSDFTHTLCNLTREADEYRDKKRAALPNGKDNSSTNIPIVSQSL